MYTAGVKGLGLRGVYATYLLDPPAYGYSSAQACEYSCQVVFPCHFIVLKSLVVKQKIYRCYSITIYQQGYLLIFKTSYQHKIITSCQHERTTNYNLVLMTHFKDEICSYHQHIIKGHVMRTSLFQHVCYLTS